MFVLVFGVWRPEKEFFDVTLSKVHKYAKKKRSTSS